jgi:glycerate kinase
MKFVIAPDSYKGCLKSIEICEYLSSGITQIIPDAEIETLPMADGGEGTVEAIVLSTGGKFRKSRVVGPLGKETEAVYGIAGNSDTAVMEMASASGIELLPVEKLNPMKATTYGTGQILKEIVKSGMKDILIGIGGSATVDGGAGMAQALGYKFLDKDSKEIEAPIGGGDLNRIESVDVSGVLPELKHCRIRIASDVTNPLLGDTGAARVFGPQKGATESMVKQLEENLKHFSDKVIAGALTDNCDRAGDGAAGGLGFGLRAFCGADSVSGAELIIKITGLKEKLAGADFVITGEGCTDFQTVHGKLCAIVAQTAQKENVPAILVSGALIGDLSELEKLFTAMFSTTAFPCKLEQALKKTPENLIRLGRSIAGIAKF